MHFQYCPTCGQALVSRALGDDGLVPWCDTCNRPWFDSFSTCIIAAVCNKQGEVLLQREKRRPEREVLVAGYIQPGESAEEAVLREVQEETSFQGDSVEYISSTTHLGGEQLMLGFLVHAEGAPGASKEILSARWVKPEEAVQTLREGSIGQALVKELVRKKAISF